MWALLMGFRDFSWVTLRTTVWDGLGLLSYSLTFALLESLGLFLILVICGFLLPSAVDPEKRLALIGTLFLVVTLWLIAGQVYSWLKYSLPGWLTDALVQTNHPYRLLWGGVFLLVTVSLSVPLVLITRQEKFKSVILETFDRISTVSFLYVLFDIIGIVIIVIRNFPT